MQFNPSMYAVDNADACTPAGVGRSTMGGNTNPKGRCYEIIYTPHPRLTGLGWVGNYWLYQGNGAMPNRQNWGIFAGYPVPMSDGQKRNLAGDQDAGTMQVSFWARGAQGGELVKFTAGLMDAFPCADFAATMRLAPDHLTTTWTHYTIPLAGQDWSATGVIGAFGFGVGARLTSEITGDAGNKGNSGDGFDSGPGDLSPPACLGNSATDPKGCLFSTQKVYIDDIEWQ
jgi:hypothetical protein